MAAAQINCSLSVNGVTVARSDVFSTTGELITGPVTLAAAFSGTLTTRSSGTAGVITTTAAHGLTTSDTIGIGWTDANGVFNTRAYCTISAVTTNTITFTAGTGQTLPALNYAVNCGKTTSSVFRIDPQANSIDAQIPVTFVSFTTAALNQSAVALIGKASEVTVGTFTNARILQCASSALPQLFWGGLGGFSSFPSSSVDTIYLAPLSTVAPVVTAYSGYNS